MSSDRLSEEEIFEQAFQQKSPEARGEFLKRICQDDEQLARIQALLKEGAPESSFLEKGPAILQDSSKRPQEIPERLGDFEILGELGRGGMGVVYRARQCSLNRMVALKVLSSGLGLNAKAIMRFKLEAEAAAKLHHTNIVPIYWTGEENRIPYYAMELIDGPSLNEVIKQLRQEADVSSDVSRLDGNEDAPIPEWIKETLIYPALLTHDTVPETNTPSFDSSSSLGSDSSYYDNIAKMIAGVGDALAHAHDHGIVHRDIKPANLLLSSDGRLSINDFGLARVLEQPGMTMTGELMGSPMYMSPEQITAGRLPLDHRTDIYSLGASLYELLTLQPPFPGQRRDQVLSQVLHKDPPKPRSINPQIPKDLETICLKAMEKDPDRRYQTAELLAEDLRRFVNRHAISARRTGPLEKGIRWVRKNKAITTSVCLALAVCLGSLYVVYRNGRAHQRDAALNEALEKAWSGRFDEAGTEVAKAISYGAPENWRPLLEAQESLSLGNSAEAVKKIEGVLEQDPDNFIAKWMLAEAYWYDGDAVRTSNILRELDNRTPSEVWERLFAAQALGWHEPIRARKYLKDVLEDNPQFTNARISLATITAYSAIDQNDPSLIKEAMREIQLATFFLEERQEEDNPTLRYTRLYAHLTAAHFFRLDGDDKSADEHLKDAEEDASYLGERHPDIVVANVMRMNYYFATRDFAGMCEVVQDIKDHGHRGWVLDPFWTTCYTSPEWARKDSEGHDINPFDRGVQELEKMELVHDDYIAFIRLVFSLEDAETLDEAKVLYARYLEQRTNGVLFDKPALLLTGQDGLLLQLDQVALEQLEAALERHNVPPDESSFVYSNLQYGVGAIDQEKYLNRLKESGRDLVFARFGIGLRELSDGNRQAALNAFEDAASGTMYHWTPFYWSHAFAGRIKEDRGWLPRLLKFRKSRAPSG